MREFDFNHPDFKKHSQKVCDWLSEHYHKKITEMEFVEAFKELRKDGHGRRRCKSRNTSNLKRHYRRLVNNYGFFSKEDK